MVCLLKCNNSKPLKPTTDNNTKAQCKHGGRTSLLCIGESYGNSDYAEQKVVTTLPCVERWLLLKFLRRSWGSWVIRGCPVSRYWSKAGRDNTVALVNRDRRNVAIDANAANNYSAMAIRSTHSKLPNNQIILVPPLRSVPLITTILRLQDVAFSLKEHIWLGYR